MKHLPVFRAHTDFMAEHLCECQPRHRTIIDAMRCLPSLADHHSTPGGKTCYSRARVVACNDAARDVEREQLSEIEET